MNPNSKPSWLIICFPAVIVAVVMFGYFRPTTQLVGLHRSAANLRGVGNRELILKSTRARASELQADLKDLEAERAKLVTRWNELRKTVGETNNRPASLTSLTAVLAANNLNIKSKQFNNANFQVSVIWQDVERKLKQPIETAFPELKTPATPTSTASAELPADANPLADRDRRIVWELELIGTYEDVECALREMIKVDPAVTPLGIEMEEPAPGLRSRVWKLTLAF
ncbi:hypothetical protein [Anatilimnocola floriformis]|uniref:hypothetical protein n=1 Tax=Anatilimnocola floriformis TaxID=2948575 RepID=UPI0020C5A119|nr:hypothetical protein [Anatilimnocola floriformis]